MENSTKRKLGKNFVYNFISQILTLIVPLITMPYVARVLHETGNGQYSFCLSIITYFILFSNLGFDIYGQRQIAFTQNDIQKKSRIFWEISIIKTFLTVISLVVLYSIIFTIGFGDKYNNLMFILSFQVAIIPFDIQFFFRGEENFKFIALKTILMKIIGLVFIFIFVRTENDTWIYALCLTLSVVFSNLLLWPSLVKKVVFIPIKEMNFKRHFLPSFFIFLPTLIITIYTVFDKTMIGFLSSNPDYDNGCYEQAYKINSVLLLFVTIISSVLVSRNASEYEKGGVEALNKNIGFACNYVWFIAIPLTIGTCLLSNNISTWLLGDGYAEVPLLLQIMSIRFVFNGFSEIFGNQFFIVIHKEKYSLYASIVAATINFGLNFLFIPMLGAIGAAITTIISEVIMTLVLFAFIIKNKYYSFSFIFRTCWKYLIAGAFLFIPVFFINRFMEYSVLSFLLATASGIFAYVSILLLLKDKFLFARINDIFSVIRKKK